MTTATPERGATPRRHRRPLRAFAVALALAISIVTPSLVSAWSAGSFSSTDEALLVQLTNNARAAAGLRALKVDSALTSMARWRSKDMSDRDYFCHRIPPKGATIPRNADGNADCSRFPSSWPRVFDYLQGSGYCYHVAGENIGTNNFPDDIATQTIQQGFMDSSGHRANILGTGWDVIGIGAYKRADGQHFWTVLFADKCSTAPAPTPKPTPAPTPKPTPRPTPRPTVAFAPAPTPRPTAAPTARATVAPDPTAFDPTPGTSSDATLEPSSAPTNAATFEPTLEPTLGPPDPTASADPAAGSGEPADLGLQVLDSPISNGLVDTIVGDVAGAYFGN